MMLGGTMSSCGPVNCQVSIWSVFYFLLFIYFFSFLLLYMFCVLNYTNILHVVIIDFILTNSWILNKTKLAIAKLG